MPSVYLHIPFCEKKCLYCDFYSIESTGMKEQFVEALEQEILRWNASDGDRTVDTIFFGGGTPSLLSPEAVRRLLDAVASKWTIAPGAEITLETNPGTVSYSKLHDFRLAGVNRLSIGVQSFHEHELRFLSRIHDVETAEQCVRDARASGFDNLSMDLIYSLPGQDEAQWRESLYRAIALEPDHISAYSLIVEDNTPLARLVHDGVVTPNPVESEASLYEATMSVFAGAGFSHYEVSNYAKPGFECRHNLAYWHHANYIGFGPSAHSFTMNPDGNGGKRWANIANLNTYLSAVRSEVSAESFREDVDSRALAGEAVFLGLRSDGLDVVALQRKFASELKPDFDATVSELIARGLAERSGPVVRLTDRGYLVCDEIAARLMP
jgi:oxygen-independent coproporphyrinogen-3 oxidase